MAMVLVVVDCVLCDSYCVFPFEIREGRERERGRDRTKERGKGWMCADVVSDSVLG